MMGRIEVFQRTRISRGDYRDPFARRLEQWIAPAFAAVQRQVAIPTLLEDSDLGVGPGFAAQFYARLRRHLSPRFGQGLLGHLCRARIALEDQDRAVAPRKGPQ